MKSSLPTALAALLLMVTAGPSWSKDVNVRGMFVTQQSKPKEKINTGITYWLELEREGKKSRVTNKSAFQNGDKLRFHVKPNIDGFAYILMVQGSKGEKNVLFPSAQLKENKVVAGKEIILPAASDSGEEAWLKFDENPGTEVLRVIVSRQAIDAQKELGDKDGVAVIASTKDDKIPDGTLVCIVLPPNAKPPRAARNLTVEVNKTKKEDQGETTVINNDPSKQLSVDIALEHRKGG